MQIQADGEYRLHPSKRENHSISYNKDDHTLFFSAVIASRLMRFRNDIPQTCVDKAGKIIREVRQASAYFKNKYGGITYNFWKTHPVNQFPGDRFLSKFTKFHIPDDADDTALLLYINEASAETIHDFKKLLDENIPGKKRKIQNTLPALSKLKAYSTWIGNRMPPEFDFCVMANVLFVFSEYKISFSRHDSASVKFMKESIEKDYIRTKPHRISPQYKSETACLYHFSFLVSKYPIQGLMEWQPKIKTRIKEKLQKEWLNPLEKNMLEASLAYLGDFSDDEKKPPSPHETFYFFYANMGSVAPNPFQAAISKSPLLNFGYLCPSLETLFRLEKEILRAKSEITDK
jgi:hypothetical protein